MLQEGWGAAAGYPGIVLDEQGAEVEGVLFRSAHLNEHLKMLDEFEGEEYERVVATVKLKNGGTTQAYIYSLRRDGSTRK